MRVNLAFAAMAIALIAFAGVVRGDHCSSAPTCQDCLARTDCGWCSEPVVYDNGTTGTRCAGFPSSAWTCGAIYSTETCQQGYLCNPATAQCELGPPGSGTTLQVCQENCHGAPNVTKVYGCNHTTKQCHVVPPGTSGAASKEVCEAVCSNKPTPKPGPAAQTYVCNWTAFTCDKAQPGHGASKEVCEQNCNANTKLYVCNSSTMTCDRVDPTTPGAVPLPQCQAICGSMTPMPTAAPSPSPPPEYIGIWRGIEIQSGYAVCEWDISINHTWAVFTKNTFPSGGGAPAKVTFAGTPFHIPNSPTLEMWIEIQTGPGAGHTMRSIGDVSGERGPETEFATMAMAAAGQPAPSSINAAMAGGGDTVLALTKCIIGNVNCVFTLQSALPPKQKKPVALQSPPKPLSGKVLAAATTKAQKPAGGPIQDECSQFGEACSVCVSHAACGWCSSPVIYHGGITGTQCAGFEGNHTPFVCPGRYSTGNCEVGYACQSGSFECEPTQPGNGMPHAVCLATCKPTPPPAPRVPQYTCNLATHQCEHCVADHCPGSMPQNQCNELCTHPHHGATPMILGVWRGIYIQQQYSVGELDLDFSGTGVTVYKDGAEYYYAEVISLGADVMLFNVTRGAHAGSSFGALYQLAMQDFGLYTQMTMAFGKFGGQAPAGYDSAMYTAGMREIVVAKCEASPCSFHHP